MTDPMTERGRESHDALAEAAAAAPATPYAQPEPARQDPVPMERPVFELRDVSVAYGGTPAVRDIQLDVEANRITALIGPSGCGKSTVLRCLNRMNDLVADATVAGRVLYHGQDIYFLLIVIGILAFLIDRTIQWFQRRIFPYRTDP